MRRRRRCRGVDGRVAEINHSKGGVDAALHLAGFEVGDYFSEVVFLVLSVLDGVVGRLGEAGESGVAVVLVDGEVGAGKSGGEVVVPCAAVVG